MPYVIETKEAYIGNGFGLKRKCTIIYYSDGDKKIQIK